MRTLRDIKILEGVPVLVRIPQIVNSVRLAAALPTIAYLRERHAKVILASHISGKGTESTRAMYELIARQVRGLQFCEEPVGAKARAMARAMVPGEVLMLENLRRDPREVKNDLSFAKELAALADIFVEDAFDVCHRAHASVVGVPEFLPSYAGLHVELEVTELSKALKPKRPSLAIICGAKFATKQPIIEKLLATYDRVYVGGALGNDFLKAKGYGVGVSLVSNEGETQIKKLLSHPRLMTPLDAIVAVPGKGRNDARVASLQDIAANEAVLDAGPQTTAALTERINAANTVLWNGPLGMFEGGFIDGTRMVARALANASAHSIVGGGDTLAAIEPMGYVPQFSFVSTGGGAMLDFLAYGTLPGLSVLD